MLDIKWIRNNKDEFTKRIESRGIKVDVDELLRLDADLRNTEQLVNNLQHAKKEKAKDIGMMKQKAGQEFEQLKREVQNINSQLEEINKNDQAKGKLKTILESLPNVPDIISVPIGKDENDNVEVRSVGIPKKIDKALSHDYLGEKLGMMDFNQTAHIAGSRYVSLASSLSRLERALINFMLDIHTIEYGFTEISPPFIVKDQAMYNVGQLPKFANESFITKDAHRLIPTGEVPLTNIVADKIIPRESLPMKFTCYSPCFRSEAGSAGKDTKGMIRLHQFAKVEMVIISHPDESDKMHEFMTSAAESVLQKLELPYRVMKLCTGDLGYAAQKTYDIEVWVPSENTYREISSCSNCGEYQSRRMNARFREFGSKDSIFVHTLNGSGLAVGRTMLAIIENYQNPDQTITIPKILQPYMNGQDIIKPIDDKVFI